MGQQQVLAVQMTVTPRITVFLDQGNAWTQIIEPMPQYLKQMGGIEICETYFLQK